jgi:hypothetical protein
MAAEFDAMRDAPRKLDERVLACKMEGRYKAPLHMEQPAQQVRD